MNLRNLRNLRKAVLAGSALLTSLATPPNLPSQDWPGHRLQVGSGAILLLPDSNSGLVLWASRPAQPGRRPAPDFVGWIDPNTVDHWSSDAAALLEVPVPADGALAESPRLVAVDGGTIALLRGTELGESAAAFALGHARERQRWLLEGTRAELRALVDTMVRLAHRSRLDVPPGYGYANPTNRRATPDRTRAPLPPVRGEGGEVWASAELDSNGAVIPGTIRILWATRPMLAKAVEAVLPQYRYQRHDGGVPARLRVYQRFRVSSRGAKATRDP